MPPLDTFLNWCRTGGPDSAGGMAEGCCGPNSLFWWAVRDAKQADPSGAGREVLAEFNRLARYLEGDAPGTGWAAGDPTLSARHRAIGLILGVFLEYSELSDLSDAAMAFRDARVGPVPRCEFKLDHAPAGDSILTRYGASIPLDRPEGWQVYDVLWHLHHGAPGEVTLDAAGGIRAREQTVVLGAGGIGYAFRLVAELLPGPVGLVTPDWWPMGLVRFPRAEGPGAGDSAASTQSLIAAALSPACDGRVRWRLEPVRPDGLFGAEPITGRSGEAAAACVGWALGERLLAPDVRVLNPSVAVTATVPDGEAALETRPLGHVAAATLPNKFAAAGDAGVAEVLLAAGQPGHLPSRPAAVRVATFADAFLEIAATNQHVRAYQAHVRATFWSNPDHPHTPGPAGTPGKWVAVETPAGGPPG